MSSTVEGCDYNQCGRPVQRYRKVCMAHYARRTGEMLVDEILRNPFVKEAVDEMVSRARWEGYEGAYKEMQTGKRYEFEQPGP